MALLSVTGLGKSFGGVRALDDIGFSIEPGMIFGIIGPNGAGKTTLFNVLSGFQRADRGSVILRGQEVLGRKPHELVALGLARSFQLVKPFLGMTVLETVMLPSYAPCLQKRGAAREVVARQAMQKLAELGLADKAPRRVDELNQGELRLLDIARALATEPDILLLDEPFSGLAAEHMAKVAAILNRQRDAKIAIVIIEHRLRELMRLAERVLVMNFGRKLAEGRPEEVLSEKAVIEAYLGTRGKAFAALRD
jgi:branched-chain amino acid transport system ATP-binding protein